MRAGAKPHSLYPLYHVLLVDATKYLVSVMMWLSLLAPTMRFLLPFLVVIKSSRPECCLYTTRR